jgi:hypothetical protein
MSIEYEAKAMGISDSSDGKKLLVFRTECGRTVKITVHTNQADFTIKQIGAPVEP